MPLRWSDPSRPHRVRRVVPLTTLALALLATGLSAAPASASAHQPITSSSPGRVAAAAPAPTTGTGVERHRVAVVPTGRALGPGVVTTVTLPAPAQMVTVAWTGTPDGTVRVRSLTAGVWSGWVDAASDPAEGQDNGAAAPDGRVGPIWTGAGTTAVDVLVTGAPLADLRVETLQLSTPASAVGLGIASTDGSSLAPAAIDIGAIVLAAAATGYLLPRSFWDRGAAPWNYPGGSICDASAPIVAPSLRYGIVHHTVNTNDYQPADVPNMIYAIYLEHTGGRGFCDIGYNFVIDRFGAIWEARTSSLSKPIVGGHAAGWNNGSVGVSLLGQHQSTASPAPAAPTPAENDALRRLLSWSFTRYGTDAGAMLTKVAPDVPELVGGVRPGDLVTTPAIIGHRDVNATSCPGDLTMPLLPALRTAVQRAVITSGPFSSLPQWRPDATQGKVLVVDRYGGIHPAGGAAAVQDGGYWPGWDIARDVVGDAAGGYVLDGFGGLHRYGDFPAVTGNRYWPGWDIARKVTKGPTRTSGYVMDAWGGIHNFGGAPPVQGSGYWPGWTIARDLGSNAAGTGGYVLDGWGGVHPFGDAPSVYAGGYWPGWDIARAIAMRPDGPGGYVMTGWGSVFPFGGAPPISVEHYTEGRDVHVAMVILPGGKGYTVDADGNVWGLGGAAPISRTTVGSGLGTEGGGESLTWTGTNLTAGIVASPAG